MKNTLNNIQTKKEEALKEFNKLVGKTKGCSTDMGGWVYPLSDVEGIIDHTVSSTITSVLEGLEKDFDEIFKDLHGGGNARRLADQYRTLLQDTKKEI